MIRKIEGMDTERGKALKKLRTDAGLLQRQVGAAFDIDKASVSSWEKGLTRPDMGKLRALDELYGADGAVLRLFGVTRSSELSPSQLARVEAVSETMKALDRRVENLEKALAAVEARLDSTDGRSLSGGT